MGENESLKSQQRATNKQQNEGQTMIGDQMVQ